MDHYTEEIIRQDEAHYLNCFGKRTPLVISHGQGSYVYDYSGKGWLDMLGGIAVNLLGHGNEALAAAVCEQARSLMHCSNLYYNRPQTDLVLKLSQLTGYPRIFLCNSGAEANEAAIKLARAYFYQKHEERYEVITAAQSFHGRTLATLTATGQEKFHKGFAPLPDGFSYVPFNDFEALKAKITPRTAAILLEPIQGERGIWPADPTYLSQVRALCDQEGILLILDEIQTGVGRTGTFLCQEQYDVRADIVTLAKGLAGGVPIGALLTTEDVATGFLPGMHGTTFGGNPLASAAALAVLAELERLKLMAHADRIGTYLKDALAELGPRIVDIRGRGLMIGFDLASDDAVALKDRLFDRGVLVNAPTQRTIRLLPPLILSEDEASDFICILKACL